jgi:hypothetical protein
MWQVNKLRIEANDSTDDAPEIVPYLAINNSFFKKKIKTLISRVMTLAKSLFFFFW